MRRTALLIAALAAVSACGTDDATPAEQARDSAAQESLISEAMRPSSLDDESILNTAYGRCIDAITVQLKAPATAQFSTRTDANEGRDGASFYFQGTVDSENGFGALLRSEWGCQIDYDQTAQTYSVIIAEVA